MLVSMKTILDKAKEGNYGVAAPNVAGSDTVIAVIEAAEELRSPIIIDFNEGRGRDGKQKPYCTFTNFGAFALPLVKNATVPIAVNLDHGGSFDITMQAMRAGFSSVMLDNSWAPFEENVKNVQEVVRVAHLLGVSVEAELGAIGRGLASEEIPLTDVDEAVKFVELTDIDMLAVAVGSTHGIYKGTPKLEFERIKQIAAKVPVPLVLHGGSYTGEDNLAKAVKCGICKINLATDLFTSGLNAMKEYLATETEWPTWNKANTLASEAYKKRLMEYMNRFDCVGKANGWQ